MAEIENIRDWQGKDVLGSDGKKIGSIEDVYFDIETDEPRFLCAKAGWLGRHVVLVPATGVSASPDHLTVSVTRAVADKAPTMDPGGELSAEVEERLFGYYGLDYRAAQTPGGRRLVRR